MLRCQTKCVVEIPLRDLFSAHEAGTLKFGADPAQSVLDPDCKAHGIDNLDADASFFPSIGAGNPTLTIIAKALRAGGRIAKRPEA